MNPSKEKGIKSRVEAFYKNDYFPTISKECENALRRFPKQQNGDVLKKNFRITCNKCINF